MFIGFLWSLGFTYTYKTAEGCIGARFQGASHLTAGLDLTAG